MASKIMFINPITQTQDFLDVSSLKFDYFDFKNGTDYKNDTDISNILDNILKDLDCTVEYSCGRLISVSSAKYKKYISTYYKYILKFNNQFLYNEYIDKLIQRHIDNIIFEYNNPYGATNKKTTNVKKKKQLPPNIYIRYVTTDLFTGETVYKYSNLRTGDEITSSNPNLLDVLNTTKKKERKKPINSRVVGVSMDAMTFNFKIK